MFLTCYFNASNYIYCNAASGRLLPKHMYGGIQTVESRYVSQPCKGRLHPTVLALQFTHLVTFLARHSTLILTKPHITFPLPVSRLHALFLWVPSTLHRQTVSVGFLRMSSPWLLRESNLKSSAHRSVVNQYQAQLKPSNFTAIPKTTHRDTYRQRVVYACTVQV